MPALRELQMAFADNLVHGGRPDFPVVHGYELPADSRLSVYRNNHYGALTSALRGTFAVTERLVGADFFRFAAAAYIRTYPSVNGDLQHYGDSFADFLGTFQPATSLHYLADVARLEWAWSEAYYAAVDNTPFDAAGLSDIPESRQERLRFRLNASVRLVASPFPILRIWEANQHVEDGEAQVDLGEGIEMVLMLQRDLDVEMFRLERGEFLFLEALGEGHDLGESYEIASAHDDALDLGAVLRKHVALGTVVSWELPVHVNDDFEHS